jgi:NAD(P)H-dependent FMN reductase
MRNDLESFVQTDETPSLPTLQVIVASTRPGRSGRFVADWVLAAARTHGAFAVELVDLAEVNLPLLDESQHPRLRQYEHEHSRRWSAMIERGDAFVVVTPEYDYATPAALSNALQYLVHEWAYKPMAFVSYGGMSGGLRGVEMTKQIATSLRMMPIPEGVAIPFFSKYLDPATQLFDPGQLPQQAAHRMLDELLKWATALAPLRELQRV